jgi:hypothetical protein
MAAITHPVRAARTPLLIEGTYPPRLAHARHPSRGGDEKKYEKNNI